MKRTLYLVGAILIAIMCIFFVNNIFSQLKEQNINIQLSNDEAEIYRTKSYIKERLTSAEEDASTITALLNGSLYNNNSTGSVDQNRIISTLKGILPNFFPSSNSYKQIAYIDKNGHQLMSVDNNGVHTEISSVNLANEEYFSSVSKQKSDKVHISSDGSLVYFSSPIYDNKGLFLGAVLLTIQKETILSGFIQRAAVDDIVLIDNGGKYIYSPNSSEAGSFISDYSKEIFDSIKSEEYGHLDLKNNTLLTHLSVQLDDEKWFLIVKADKQEITSHSMGLQRRLIAAILITLGSIIVLIRLWSTSYRKAALAKKLKEQNEELEELNGELYNKQFQLEEQNAMVEELNAQLEEESVKFQHQKDTLHAIIESTGEGILMTDTSGEIAFVNRKWQEMFNHYINTDKSIDTLQYMKNILYSINGEEESLPKLKDLLTNYKEKFTVELEQTTTSKKYINLYSVPCVAGSSTPLGRIFVSHDITHIKEIDRLKSELISTVSHELRTPMSSIMGFSELLLTRNLSPERSKEYMEIIYKESHRLTRLINDFLDIQRIENGKQVFEKKNISFGEILNRTMELFKNTDIKHRIIYGNNTKSVPEVYCDADKILQVLSNLMSNAIKYSPEGGEILVNAVIEDKMLKVSIEDHGLGIPDEAKGNLFSKFFRINNDDRREIGGTGLGLAICKEIVQAHKGEIWVESTYGEGSTFYFTLPLSENSSLKVITSKNEEENKPIGGNAILIVEDDENFAKFIEDILMNDGFETYAVNNGEEALKFVNEINPKAIILDIVLLGKLNGWDVLKELKESNKTAGIPVVISSVYDNENNMDNKGNMEYLKKPFESNKLLNVLHKVMKKDLDEREIENGETTGEYVVNSLKRNGVRVKEFKQHEDIVIMTLDGE